MREDEYVARVVDAGLDSRVLQAQAELSRAESVGVALWPNPSIEWERQPNPTDDRVVGGQHAIVASIPLVLSGRLALEATAAERSADAAEARRDRARAELRSDATVAFATVLRDQERSAVLARSVETLDELTRIVEAREKEGEAAGYEKSRITLERGLAANELEALEIDRRRSVSAALRLMGSEADIELSGSLTPGTALPDVAALLATIETRRADLAALQLDAESADLAARAAARRWIPDPSIQAGALILEDARSGEEVGTVVGLRVEVPLFDRGQGQRATAKASRLLAAVRHHRLLEAARSDLLLAVQTLELRRTQLRHYRENVLAQARELQQSAAAGYRGGEMELLALVDAERNARHAELAAIELAFETKEAETRLMLVSGIYDTSEKRGPE